MQTLYPAIKTYAQHTLAVDPPHVLYIEECGNPKGLPILILHSGPGAGCENYHRQFFDPSLYRMILFDQRGAGQSKPHAELLNNHTQGLLSDIEAIRKYLDIQEWLLFGGAWGSALSLLYAESYPECVMGMILHGIFLARPKDITWFYQEGTKKVYPDYWEEFIQPIPKKEHSNILMAYHKRLTGKDEVARMSAAKSFSLWQARCTSLQPHVNTIDHFADPYFAIGLATIESHYFANRCFVEEDQILTDLKKIEKIPAFIIHGRYDMVCPLESAWELHQNWPASQLLIVRDAGHDVREPGIIDAIIFATQKMSKTPSPAC